MEFVVAGLVTIAGLVCLLVRSERNGAKLHQRMEQMEAEDRERHEARRAQNRIDRDDTARNKLRDRFRR